MEQTLPVTYSTIQSQSLVDAIWPDYSLTEVTGCQLQEYGLNDHYFVTTREDTYILRVYHHGWRTEDDIAYELALLAFLDSHGVSVCAPVLRRDGKYFRYILAPEGPRAVALFRYAAGSIPDPNNGNDYHLYGRALALIHRHSDAFHCPYQRFQLDIGHLTTQPLKSVSLYLSHRPDDIIFVNAVAERLQAGLQIMTDDLEWGVCHGDFHGGNAHIDANSTLRVFDFDCSGLGWRAYDLAVCRWGGGKDDAAWEAFCHGYESVYEISTAMRTAIPWFVVARQLWLIGLHAHLVLYQQIPGRGWLNDHYYDHHLGLLRELIEKYLPDLGDLTQLKTAAPVPKCGPR